MLAGFLTEADWSTVLPLAITLTMATIVLASIALDLRRLRRESRLKAVHAAIGAFSTAIVLSGSLVMCLAIGTVPSANAQSGDLPQWPATDITDVSTDIQLPTL